MPLIVRMALHTGPAEANPDDLRSGQYVSSITLSTTSRLLSAAHGGQILLSTVTEELAREQLPPDAELRDLGTYRLRDLARPQRIFQLSAPGLPNAFPPLVATNTALTNIPVAATSFVGRSHELAEVKALLAGTRLLTLAGTGGTGKTRLALQVAAEVRDLYPDGAWLVELAPLSDPALVPQAIASALGVREQPGHSLLDMLEGHLLSRTMLLVLDNCEHMLDACVAIVVELQRSAPGLTVLTTSREPLGVSGEVTYRVPSLSLPATGAALEPDDLLQYEAVRLFVERVRAMLPNFQLTAQNARCHRPDLPPPGRHSPGHRAGRRPRACAFAGTDRRAPRRSLQASDRRQPQRPSPPADPAGPGRLELRPALGTRTRPAPPPLGLFRRLDARGRRASDRLPGPEFCGRWLGWRGLGLRRAGLALPPDRPVAGRRRYRRRGGPLPPARNDPPVCARKASGRRRVYARPRPAPGLLYGAARTGRRRVHVLESYGRAGARGRQFPHRPGVGHRHPAPRRNPPGQLSDRFLGRPRPGDRGPSLAERSAADCLWRYSPTRESSLPGDRRLCCRHIRAGLPGLRPRGLPQRPPRARGECGRSSSAWDRRYPGQSLGMLAVVAALQGDARAARSAADESLELARQSADRRWLGFAFYASGEVAGQVEGDQKKARALFGEAVRLGRAWGGRMGQAMAVWGLGMAAYREGLYDEARAQFRESMRIYDLTHARTALNVARSALADVARKQGRFAEATSLYREAMVEWRQLGNLGAVARCMECIAFVTAAQADAIAAQPPAAPSEKSAPSERSALSDRPAQAGLASVAATSVAGASAGAPAGSPAPFTLLANAARLLGAAQALRESGAASPMTAEETVEYERLVAAARAVADPSAFDAAWNEGCTLTAAQAIDYTLKNDLV